MASQITALSRRCHGSHWSMSAFTLVQTSELLLQPKTQVCACCRGANRMFVMRPDRDAQRTPVRPGSGRNAETSTCGNFRGPADARKIPAAAAPGSKKSFGVQRCAHPSTVSLPLSSTHARTQTRLQLEQLMSILAANYCSFPTPPS